MGLKKAKAQKGVFVIMPFVRTPTRDQSQLLSFFENNIRKPIEQASLEYQYKVWRSGETFNITDEIIRDLFKADIVIADLSGEDPNPNVMYELGVRLTLSEKPVVLIREKNPKNKKVFDVDSYYIHPYDPLNYTELEKHLISKLSRFETGEETFESPVKKVLHDELILSQPKLSSLSPSQQKEIVLRGINLIKISISESFGPLGKGIPVTDRQGSHTLSKRGYDIARASWSQNPLENRGIEFLSEIGRIMLEKVGDGSKVAILLASQMIESGNEALKSGFLSKHIITGMKMAIAEATTYVNQISFLPKDKKQIEVIAATASKNSEIGGIIADCLNKVGKLGVIDFVKSDSQETQVEIIEGFSLDVGYFSSDFVTSENSTVWEFEKSGVLIYPYKISNHTELIPIMEQIADAQLPLLIICKEISESALDTLLLNVQKEVVRAVAITVPHLNSHWHEVLIDIAIKTGGKVISPTRGLILSNISIQDLGMADKVIVTSDHTKILGGKGTLSEIKKRIEKIDEVLLSKASSYESQEYRDRLAMLMGATAIVHVGGVTPQEKDENLYAFSSALNSAVSAIAYGVIPGGAISLYKAIERVSKIHSDDPGVVSGIEAVKKSLVLPLNCLIENCNLVPDDVVIKIEAEKSKPLFFNADREKIESFEDAMIYDPTDILIKALKVAMSHTKMFLETTVWADQRGSTVES